jgi:hypothetical protein
MLKPWSTKWSTKLEGEVNYCRHLQILNKIKEATFLICVNSFQEGALFNPIAVCSRSDQPLINLDDRCSYLNPMCGSPVFSTDRQQIIDIGPRIADHFGCHARSVRMTIHELED